METPNSSQNYSNSFSDLFENGGRHEVCKAYEKMGYEAASRVNGNSKVLPVKFSDIEKNIIAQTQKHKSLKEKREASLRENIQQLRDKIQSEQEAKNTVSTEIKDHKNEIASLKGNRAKRILELRGKIEDIEEELRELKSKKTDKGENQNTKFIYYISVVILILLTVFLFIYYIYAIHGVFFRDFQAVNLGEGGGFGAIRGIGTNIFSSNPIPETWEKAGVLGVLLILACPVVFLAIGLYSIILGLNKYNNLFIQLLSIIIPLVVAFGLDYAIAYHIVKKVHQVNYNANLEEEPWSQFLNLTKVEFWIIMMLGFVMYLVWARILAFISKEKGINLVTEGERKRLKDDKKGFERKIEEIKIDTKMNIEIIENSIKDSENKFPNLDEQINNFEKKIKEISDELDKIHVKGIILRPELKANIDCFTGGWCNWIEDNIGNNKKKGLIEDCIAERNNYLNEIMDSDRYHFMDIDPDN